MKNDNFQSFFSLFWLQILNLPASLQNKNTRVAPFPWKRSVLQNPDRERTNQSTGICLRLGLPYKRVSRKTAKNLAVRRKNETILTVSRKKIQPQNKVSRSFVESDVLCVYVFW